MITVMIVRDGSFFIDRIQMVRASEGFEYRERPGQVIVENEINLAVLECLGSTKVA